MELSNDENIFYSLVHFVNWVVLSHATSATKCSTDTQNRWWYRIIQINTIWSTCFSEDHIEKYGKILFSSLIYTVKILPCLTVLHWLLISLSAFSLARKFLYIIILLKLAFLRRFLCFFYHSKLLELLLITRFIYIIEIPFLQI